MKTITHRVESKRRRIAPPALPKEVIQTAPREYVDRFGQILVVTWDGAMGRAGTPISVRE